MEYLSPILIGSTLFCLALIFYHYLGYPLLLVVWTRLKRSPVERGSVRPSMSLIISAFNEERVIAAKLENSLALDYPELEIIVVSDGSTDATSELVRKFGEHGVIGLHADERRGKSAAINRAAIRASGDLLVLSDANAYYEPDALRKLARNFADPTVGCVSGKKTVRAPTESGAAPGLGKTEGFYWRYESFIKSLESNLYSTVAVVGEMLALRRELFEPIPIHVINDDAYLGLSVLRRGYRVLYEPDAICWELPVASSHDDLLRRRRMTAGRFQLLFEPGWLPWRDAKALVLLGSHKILRLLLPLLMLVALSANTLAVLLPGAPPLMKVLLLLQGGFYLLAVLGLLGDRIQWCPKPLALVFYIVNGNFATLAGLASYARGTHSVLWTKARR